MSALAEAGVGARPAAGRAAPGGAVSFNTDACRPGALAAGTDGDIGIVVDVIFDSSRRMLSHLLVDTRHSLQGGQVLIPLHAVVPGLEQAPGSGHCIAVALSCRQVVAIMASGHGRGAADWTEDPDLHSCQRMLGGTTHGSDGPIGRLQDLIFDDRTWTPSHAVVNIRPGWPGGRCVVVDAGHMAGITRDTGELQVVRTRAQVWACPAYRGFWPGAAQRERATQPSGGA